jgi:hypothetical protein
LANNPSARGREQSAQAPSTRSLSGKLSRERLPLPGFACCRRRQRGAALVEFAIVITLFLLLVLGGMDFGRLMFDVARTVEASRIGVRTAVVTTPPSAYRTGDRLNLTCPGVPLGDGLSIDAQSALLLAMQSRQPRIQVQNVRLIYQCASAGSPQRAEPLPVVTVAVVGLRFTPLFSTLLGLPATIPIPTFPSSMLGESLRDMGA